MKKQDIGSLLNYIPASIERARRILITSTLNAMGEQEAAVRWQSDYVGEKKAKTFVKSCKPKPSFIYNVGILVNEAKKTGWHPSTNQIHKRVISRKVYTAKTDPSEYHKKLFRYKKALLEYNNSPQVCFATQGKNTYLGNKIGRFGCIMLQNYNIDIRQVNGGIAYQANNGTIHKIFDEKKPWLGGGNKQVIMHQSTEFNGQYFQIGNIYHKTGIVIAEGLATGLTLALCGYVVCVCICAHNIKHVVDVLKKQHPDSKILIATDNDSHKENTGLKETLKSGADFYSMPSEGGMDWNDVYLNNKFSIEDTKVYFKKGIFRL